MYLEKKFTSKNPIPPPLPKLTWLYDMRRSSISNAAAVESRFFKYTPPPTKFVFNPSSGLLASLFVKVEEINKNLVDVVIGGGEWTLAIAPQGITANAGVAVTQGAGTGTLKTTLQNEWTLEITSQEITKDAGVYTNYRCISC